MYGLKKKITQTFLAFILPILNACQQPEVKTIDVLFIGNSSIYYNNLPKMLEYISHENGIDLRTKLVAYGGYTLQDHLSAGVVQKTLDSIDWDFVILNEQSTLGENYMVDGVQRVRESDSFYKSVRMFNSLIEEHGSQTIIISLYPRKNSPAMDREILDYSYMKIAKELEIKLAPVSYTWDDILRSKNHWQLYREDDLHPTPLGSFITANVLYSSITNQKSKPLQGAILGSLIEENDGYNYEDSIVTLISVEKSISIPIIEKAYENVKSLKRAGGYYPLVRPKYNH